MYHPRDIAIDIHPEKTSDDVLAELKCKVDRMQVQIIEITFIFRTGDRKNKTLEELYPIPILIPFLLSLSLFFTFLSPAG